MRYHDLVMKHSNGIVFLTRIKSNGKKHTKEEITFLWSMTDEQQSFMDSI